MDELRAQVADASRRLAAAGLVRGTSGNVSARDGDRVAITPTGAPLATLRADQIAVVGLDGSQLDGDLAPTSEIDLHLSVYARYASGAVVHTHAPCATAVACVVEELPAIHYEMLALGGAVRVAPYATFGTRELADNVVEALEGKAAVLLANHGTVTHGGDLAGAVNATELLEWAAELFLRASELGEPRELSEEQLGAVVEAVASRGYGVTKPTSR